MTSMVCVLNSEGKTISRRSLADSLRELTKSLNDSLDDKHARIGVVLISDEPWMIENGFLTTTQKIRRSAIDEAYLDRAQPLATQSAMEKRIIIDFIS